MLASPQISPPGPEVQGKYSADLFVQRAQTIFSAQQKARKSGRGADDMKPWFTYLSFQSVHDPLQVRYPYMSGLDSVRISIPVLVQVTFGSSSHQEVKIQNRHVVWSRRNFSSEGWKTRKCISCLDHKFTHGYNLDYAWFCIGIISGLLP